MKSDEQGVKRQTNAVKVIREKCMDCCGNQWKEVELCTAELCPLWPWRFGKNPYRKPRTEAQIKAAKENMERLRRERVSGKNSP